MANHDLDISTQNKVSQTPLKREILPPGPHSELETLTKYERSPNHQRKARISLQSEAIFRVSEALWCYCEHMTTLEAIKFTDSD